MAQLTFDDSILDNSLLQNALRLAVYHGSRIYTDLEPLSLLPSRSTILTSTGSYYLTYMFKPRCQGENYENSRALTYFKIGPSNPREPVHQNLEYFDQYSSMQILDLSNNRFCGVIGDYFNNLKQLRTLDLRNNILDGKTNQINLFNCENLRSLYLGGNRLTDCEYERKQLRSTIPSCEVDFGTPTGREKKLFLHLTWVEVENKFYAQVMDNLHEIEQFHESENNRYLSEHKIRHSSAILDLNIFEDNEIQIIRWNGYRSTGLEKKFIDHAEKFVCPTYRIKDDSRPFVVVKHTQQSGEHRQHIKRFSTETEARSEFDNDNDDKSMAIYDLRNGIDNIREVKFKGVKITNDFYNIEKDFNQWMKKLVFSNYFTTTLGITNQIRDISHTNRNVNFEIEAN